MTPNPLTPNADDALHRAEIRAKRFWLGGICSIFAAQFAIWGIAVVLTHRDPAYAVVPEYDWRAMHWNEYVAAQRASEALHWTCHVEAGDLDALWERPLRIVFRDAEGVLIGGADVRVRMFHQAQAGQQLERVLQEQRDGSYLVHVPMRRAGWWRLHITAQRGDASYLDERAVHVTGLPR